MKNTSANMGFIQGIKNFFKKIINSKDLSIPSTKLIFRPNNKSTIESPKNKKNTDFNKHNHKPNTRPVAEKQSLLKEKKK